MREINQVLRPRINQSHHLRALIVVLGPRTLVVVLVPRNIQIVLGPRASVIVLGPRDIQIVLGPRDSNFDIPLVRGLFPRALVDPENVPY